MDNWQSPQVTPAPAPESPEDTFQCHALQDLDLGQPVAGGWTFLVSMCKDGPGLFHSFNVRVLQVWENI